MAINGTYGTKKPAMITSNDVTIYYHYRPNRNSDSPNFNGYKTLESTILSSAKIGENGNILPGMYNLKLPLDKFKDPGIYTIYITPIEIQTEILDVSTLAAYPNVRGIVIKTSGTNVKDSTIFNNGGLVGYRVEYLDENNNRQEEYRLITSSNRCEPVAQNLNDSTQKGVRYRFNDSSNIIFCTLTPSVAMSFKANATPFIGSVGQTIKLINTKFNPVCIELELTEHDIETVATMLEGDQVRDLDSGIITTFDSNGEIYHQSTYGHATDKNGNGNIDFKFNKKDDVFTDAKDKLEDLKESLE